MESDKRKVIKSGIPSFIHLSLQDVRLTFRAAGVQRCVTQVFWSTCPLLPALQGTFECLLYFRPCAYCRYPVIRRQQTAKSSPSVDLPCRGETRPTLYPIVQCLNRKSTESLRKKTKFGIMIPSSLRKSGLKPTIRCWTTMGT